MNRRKLNQEKSRNVPEPFSKELEDCMVGELKGVELSKRDQIVLASRQVPPGQLPPGGNLSEVELVRGEVVRGEVVLFRCLPARGTCPGGTCP